MRFHMVDQAIPAKNVTSWSTVARSVAASACFAVLGATVAVAQVPIASPAVTATPGVVSSPAAGTAAPPDCTIVGPDEISMILGYAVGPADESSRASGICFFSSRSISEEGSASYAIVDAEHLQQRRAYYAALARRCAGVAPGAPRYVVCKTFSDLAQVKDIDAYFAARTAFPNAEEVKGLGDAAVAAGDALYVKRGEAVYEFVVRRGDALDVDRATSLAKLVLARTATIASPEPSSSPRRPKPL
jgi:hypothetical protein